MDNHTDHTFTEYLEGKLSGRALEAFEERLSTEPALLEKLEDHALVEEMKRKLRAASVRETLSGIRNERVASDLTVVHRKNRTRRILYWGVAASFLILAVFFTWFDNPQFNDQIYADYLTELAPSETVRSADADAVFQQAYRAYTNGDYAESTKLFGELVSEDESNLLYRMWSGISHMQQKEYTKALERFESSRVEKSIYNDRIQILKAMALIRLDRNIEALAMLNQLIDSGSDYTKEARRLKKYAEQ